MQLVKYTMPRYFAVGFPEGNQGTVLKTITLLPGINELSDKDWSLLKGHPLVQEVIKKGQIRLVSKRPGSEMALSEMSQAEAIALVQGTHSVELLEKWAETEKRSVVNREIRLKLDTLVLPDRRAKILKPSPKMDAKPAPKKGKGKPAPKKAQAYVDQEEDTGVEASAEFEVDEDEFESEEYAGRPLIEEDPFPRADKLGEDVVARKIAGKGQKRR